jgi:hypothetical protein
MARFNGDTLLTWTKPASDSEETKLSNSERMVREAINGDSTLSTKSTEVFGQGSYANDTKREDFGLNSPSAYSLEEFKNDVHAALINKFGSDSILRKNKCITVLGNSYRVETDVVPTWNYRCYNESGGYVLGAKLRADTGSYVVNFPKQHIENGKQKNSETYRRFKRLTRIYRKLRYKMIDDGFTVSDSITSFLLECLVWNVPNSIFNDNDSWDERLKASIVYLYESTEDEEKCDEWGEVSELLYLFRGNRKWTKKDVNSFIVDSWNYLEY